MSRNTFKKSGTFDKFTADKKLKKVGKDKSKKYKPDYKTMALNADF